jgi:mannose-binding lectin 2
VNETWTYGGHAEAKKHFVRLTTDRQSKRGYLWQTEPVNRDTLSLVLTFRISGRGSRWFGDGIGLWFTNHASFQSGDNHGFTDRFHGVGVVVDTFVNPEHRGGHKDVSVQVNDGTKTLDQLNDEPRQGCDSAVRYNENAATFDPVHSISRLKVKIERQKLAVEIDAGSTGRWIACYETTLPLNADWLRTSTIGITGATGALADNHDVIRFEAFSDFTDTTVGLVDSETIMHTVSKDYKKWMDSPNCGADCLIAVLQKELANFRVEAEHRFTDLKEKTENTVSKLKKQELENERRVAEIEEKTGDLIDRHVEAAHDAFGKTVEYKITKELNANPSGAGWKTPFLLLSVVLGVGGLLVYRKYVALMKSHLL